MSRPGESHADTGIAPDRRRYLLVLATTAISVTGAFTAFTHVTPFLRDVSGLGPDAVSALLTGFGAGGLFGVLLVGAFGDRFPSSVIILPVCGQVLALGGLWAFGDITWVSAIGVFALGLTAAPIYAATSGRVLHVAPGRTDVASAANSAAFNVGLAAGGALGGLIVAAGNIRMAFALGAIVSAIGDVVSMGDRPPRTA